MLSARLLIACAVALPIAAQAHLVPMADTLQADRLVFLIALAILAFGIHIAGGSVVTFGVAMVAFAVGVIGASVEHVWLYRAGALALQVALCFLFAESALTHYGRVRAAGVIAGFFAGLGAVWFLTVNVILSDELGWSPEARSIATRTIGPYFEVALGAALYLCLALALFWPRFGR